MAEPFVDEIIAVVRELVPKALERLERGGEQKDNDWPRLYLRSKAERMTLAIARGKDRFNVPIVQVEWYDLDDKGVAIKGALLGGNIPISDSPPFENAVTEDTVWRFAIASAVDEYRAKQPEMFRRAIRTIENGSKITQDEFMEPYDKWLEKRFGHLK